MPFVSVIVPCFNEEKTIALLLSAIECQDWEKSEIETLIADGLSTDRTRAEIARFQQDHPEMTIRVVDNPRRAIPSALNAALQAARGEIIVRLDAHCKPKQDYIRRCVEAITEQRGEVVGGVWQIEPSGSGWFATSIAAAASHPLGVGDALYRFTRKPALVDTVPFGSFRRSILSRIGFYDETLLTNEDYEFNTRVRLSGGRIWLDPGIRSIYFSRPNLSSLARQYFRYGFWKFQMLRRYPKTVRWRQAIPPVFVLSLVVLTICALFWPFARLVLGIEIAAYSLALVVGSISPARLSESPRFLIGVPIAIATMHICWGAGFLGSMVKSLYSQISG